MSAALNQSTQTPPGIWGGGGGHKRVEAAFPHWATGPMGKTLKLEEEHSISWTEKVLRVGSISLLVHCAVSGHRLQGKNDPDN